MKAVLGAYWNARADTVEDCAERASALLSALAPIDPLLTDWRDKAGSRRNALAQPLVTTNYDDLVHRLFAGRNRTDVGNEVIENLGYAVSWWNSRENREGGITLRLHLGVTSPHVSNSVVLNLPDSRQTPRLYEKGAASALLSAVISIFQPDRASWSSNDLKKAQAEPDQELPNGGIAYGQLIGHPAGWATYLADRSGISFDPDALPKDAVVEKLESGTLVIVGENPADPPLSDVLAVRVAMGYPAPQDLTSYETNGAAPGEKAGSGSAPVEEHSSDRPTKAATEEGKSLS
ncbi:hypothetical protein O6072_18020 [Mycolicibacterium neoaurum]|uniref:Imm52 family immunity protein n=1 Tax=Mycolicibacterium neoaurum TaxID=1795 RepID=UPI00248B487B|nr:Imm52 family immunity protein [Mycolicibacterium neoaurum]WBP93106.1 hypothetical protein O7W24_18295 [Mycolicibacterium neoaurum]WBS06754.1 hypothetical protein O6072_18020 [Mycolicibacterium neoaurum]